jgi:hypothetical protein
MFTELLHRWLLPDKRELILFLPPAEKDPVPRGDGIINPDPKQEDICFGKLVEAVRRKKHYIPAADQQGIAAWCILKNPFVISRLKIE